MVQAPVSVLSMLMFNVLKASFWETMFIPVSGGGCLILLGPSQNTVWK